MRRHLQRINAIHKNRDFRVSIFGLGAVVTDTAQRHRDHAMIALRGALKARRKIGQISNGLDMRLLQISRANRGDGNRRAL
jgi:hypothetical protein